MLHASCACVPADDDEGGPRPPAGAAAGGAGEAEDVKGPHTNLAVRLSKRDPNKKWLLGERLSYVLLTGRQQPEQWKHLLSALKMQQEAVCLE